MPPKKRSKTRQPKKQDFPCDKRNNIFHTTRTGFVVHYSRDCTGPPTQLEIPKKATEETHQFEQYYKAAESFDSGQESLNEAESRINNHYSVASNIEREDR